MPATQDIRSARIMARKRKIKQKQATLYADIPATLKERIEAIAQLHGRKINAEVTVALQRYADQIEAEENISPSGDAPSSPPAQ